MELPEELQERIDIIRHKLKFIEQKPTVAIVKQLDPLTLWGDEITQPINIAGGTAVLAGYVQWQNLLEINPDIFIVMLQGFTIEESMRELNQLLELPDFTELKAVKNNRLYIVDGTRDIADSDTQLVDTIEIFAEIINPKQFIFGYEGEGWIKFGL